MDAEAAAIATEYLETLAVMGDGSVDKGVVMERLGRLVDVNRRAMDLSPEQLSEVLHSVAATTNSLLTKLADSAGPPLTYRRGHLAESAAEGVVRSAHMDYILEQMRRLWRGDVAGRKPNGMGIGI